MKKATIISLVLIAVGLILIISSFIAAGFDFSKLGTSQFVEKEFTIEENFSNIRIRVPDGGKISFLPSENGECKIVCTSPESNKYSAKVQKDTLIFSQDPKKWYQYIFSFNFGRSSTTVYLPEKAYKDLSVVGDTSGIELFDDFSFENVDIETDTGKVVIGCSVTKSINVNTDTGSISISGYPTEDIYIESDTGSITVSDAMIRNRLYAESDTGKVRVENCEFLDAQIDTDTGSITLKNSIAYDSIKITSDTGSVKLLDCDAMKVHVDTDTGSVSGKMLSDMTFFARSSTGRVNVPGTVSEKVCEITTDTGNIEFE